MARFIMVDNEIIKNKEMSSNDKIIYIYLISLYNKEKGYSFPSLENISEHTGISLSTVKRSIKHLSELEFITVEKRKAKIGNYNLYTKLKHLISPKKESEIVDVATAEEIKESNIINNRNVRLLRKHVDIDRNNGLREIITTLSYENVRKGLLEFNKKISNGNWKVSCAANVFRDIIDIYYKEEINIPWRAFNYYRKYINNLAIQPNEINNFMRNKYKI